MTKNVVQVLRHARSRPEGLHCICLAAVFVLLATLALPAPVHAGGNVSVTRQFSPSANAAVAGQGDGNGFQTNPTYAYADGGGSAVDTNSGASENSNPTGTGTDKHNFYNYGFASVIPSGSTINGITVRADISVDSTTYSPFTAIRLSWDGGTSWTSVKQTTLTATAETTYTYGGSADTWGRTWSTTEISDANFRVQVINGDTRAQNSLRDFSLDWIPVSITYTAVWDSHTDAACADPAEDTFASPNYYVYMKGTGWPTGQTYKVTYYDAGGAYVARTANVALSGTTLQPSGMYLGDKIGATAGAGWHAVVQPNSASDPGTNNYANMTGSPDTYGVMANDAFTVDISAIPEFPTIMAAVATMALCALAYLWLKRRRLAYVEA